MWYIYITALTTTFIYASQEIPELKHKSAHVSFEVAYENHMKLIRERKKNNMCPKCGKDKNTIACILLH